MGTLLGVVDFIVLLLLIVQTLRAANRELLQGSGSLVLSICLVLALIIFGIISISAYLGLVDVVSSLTKGIFLLVLLGMAAILSFSLTSKPSA